MSAWMFILGFGIFFGGAALAATIGAKKRREAFERLAAARGWQFVREGTEYAAALSHFPLLNKGYARRAYNVLHGGEGDAEFWLFDYRYTVRSGKNSRTYRQTVVAFPRLPANLPSFELRPEHLFHKIGAVMGFQDIDLPRHADFSARYLLRGSEPSAIRELFDDELVRAIQAERPRSIEGGGSALLVFRHKEKVNTSRVMEALENAQRFRDAFAQRADRGAATPAIATLEPLAI